MSKAKSSRKRTYVIETRTSSGVTRRISDTPLIRPRSRIPRTVHPYDLMSVPPCESELAYLAYEHVIQDDELMEERFARLMGWSDFDGKEVAE